MDKQGPEKPQQILVPCLTGKLNTEEVLPGSRQPSVSAVNEQS